MDTTVGVVTLASLLQLSRILISYLRLKTLQYGEYGLPPRCPIWARQVLFYTCLLLLNKLIMIQIINMLASLLRSAGLWLLAWLQDTPRIELAVVMVLTPFAMNVFQFWTLDQLIKADWSMVLVQVRRGDRDSELCIHRINMQHSKEDLAALIHATYDASSSDAESSLMARPTRQDEHGSNVLDHLLSSSELDHFLDMSKYSTHS